VSGWGMASVTSAGPGEACTACAGLACTAGAGNAVPVAPAYVGEAGCYMPIPPWLEICPG
jgi:hypothetical protein